MITNWISKTRSRLAEHVHIAPLSLFRVLFGAMMFASVLRFAMKGWIHELYIKPQFFFKYYGFEWVTVPSETGLYVLFGTVALSSLFLMIGLFYRFSSLIFFLSFTYVELMDKTNYLNHYYFISIVAFLMIFLPAGKYFSLDVYFRPSLRMTHIPKWWTAILQLQLGMVYFFAGLAKLNPDWLFHAQPLRIWLQPHTDMPLIGFLMDKVWIAYFFSWFGAFYDLSIPFFLLNQRTRTIAYFFVIVFHVLTAILFPIGMFPYIMIICTLIFFPPTFHISVINKIRSLFFFLRLKEKQSMAPAYTIRPFVKNALVALFITHFFIQLIIPFRFLFYPGKLFWTEQGYRFSWRVMLMEKAGTAFFYVTDLDTHQTGEVMMNNYLTPNQEKMMATQPDMILQYANFLKQKFRESGMENPKITVESYVTLNGKGSRMFLDPSIDLLTLNDGFGNKDWILPFDEK
ncbi:MAG: HTTM domain-containing protein [Bacteroidota bacterium]|nr:HTTM domain-containing protein [Bacteroidota bacterium]